jgi:8-oxo-dGTP pyrophosphatase MutT (NUDIX family)
VSEDPLRAVLLSPEEAAAMSAPGSTDAAVLLAMYGYPDEPGLVFTERRADLRRHPGEISFPGGRQDHPGEDLRGKEPE